MTPCTIGSVAHVQYRASCEKNVFKVLESPEKVLEFFSKQESLRMGSLNYGELGKTFSRSWRVLKKSWNFFLSREWDP